MNELAQLGKAYYKQVRANRERDLSAEYDTLSDVRILGPLLEYCEDNYIDVPMFDWVDYDPYHTVEELRLAAMNGTVKMRYYEPNNTPAQTNPETFSVFRAYHDFIHHVLLGLSFSPFDEYRASMMLLPLYNHDKTAQAFVYANVGLMNAVYAWSPSKWGKLDNLTDCLCICPYHHTLSPHREEWGNV